MLTEFLFARIAEDEASTDDHWQTPPGFQRLTAECEVKRVVVRFLSDLEHGNYEDPVASSVAYSVLCRMASVYADHPDFDPDWRI